MQQKVEYDRRFDTNEKKALDYFHNGLRLYEPNGITPKRSKSRTGARGSLSKSSKKSKKNGLYSKMRRSGQYSKLSNEINDNERNNVILNLTKVNEFTFNKKHNQER